MRPDKFIDRPLHPDEAMEILGISPSPRASQKAWKAKRRDLKKEYGLHPVRINGIREDRYMLSEVLEKRPEIIVNLEHLKRA